MGRGNGNKQRQRQRHGARATDDAARPAPGRPTRANPATAPATPAWAWGVAPPGLGAVLHGEFTTNVTGTPTVMVVQTGQVTAYTAGKSLTVKSTDGFEATYMLDGTTATAGRGAAQLANGVQVRVLAAKDGMKVTALSVG